MSLLHLFLVSIIQGITEFLPISSSGHLILLPKLTGMTDQGLAIDIATHIGTLIAVCIFFWKDLREIVHGVPSLLRGRTDTYGSRLAFLLAIATAPVMIAGLIFKVTGMEDMVRSTAIIAWTMLIFGLVLYWADQKSGETKTIEQWNVRDAIALGLWQAIALIPGTSRSGICITGARFMNYTRTDAARISMLMSIPTTLMAALMETGDVLAHGDMQTVRDGVIVAVLSFIFALITLKVMFMFLKTVSYTPYVIYRIVLGVILLWIVYA